MTAIKDKLKILIKKEIFSSEIKLGLQLFNGENINVSGYGIYDEKNPSKTTSKNKNRYYLEFDLENNEQPQKTLITLMMNPSWTFPPNKIDATVKNVIKIAYKENYSKVVILNAIPIINSKNDEAITNVKKQAKEANTKFIIDYLSSYKDNNAIFLAAYGSDKNINNYICKKEKNEENCIIDVINTNFKRRIKAYEINKSDTPSHPSPLNREKLNKYFKNGKLKPIKKINDDCTVELDIEENK